MEKPFIDYFLSIIVRLRGKLFCYSLVISGGRDSWVHRSEHIWWLLVRWLLLATSLVWEWDNALIVILLTCPHMNSLASARWVGVASLWSDRKHVLMRHILFVSCTLERSLLLPGSCCWNMVGLRVTWLLILAVRAKRTGITPRWLKLGRLCCLFPCWSYTAIRAGWYVAARCWSLHLQIIFESICCT